jgi:hypothetical protein
MKAKIRKSIIFSTYFLLIGICGLSLATSGTTHVYNQYILNKNLAVTSGIIKDIERVPCDKPLRPQDLTKSCVTLIVQFLSNGTVYESRLEKVSPGANTVGDSIRVVYNKENPRFNRAGYAEANFDYYYGGAFIIAGLLVFSAMLRATYEVIKDLRPIDTIKKRTK